MNYTGVLPWCLTYSRHHLKPVLMWWRARYALAVVLCHEGNNYPHSLQQKQNELLCCSPETCIAFADQNWLRHVAVLARWSPSALSKKKTRNFVFQIFISTHFGQLLNKNFDSCATKLTGFTCIQCDRVNR